MKAPFLVALLGAAALMTATPAFADITTNDVHCYIVFMQMGSSLNPVRQDASTLGMLYYMGRLDARTAGFDLEAGIIAELPVMKGAVRTAEAQRCSQEMEDRGTSANAMAEDLQLKLELQRQKENSN